MKKKEKIQLICKSIKENRYPLKISKKDTYLKGNCYAYAIGSKYEESDTYYDREYIYNLGSISNLPDPATSKEAENAFIADMKVLDISVRESYLKEKVKKGEWKIALFFEEDNNFHDFHFIRQDEDGKWSEKEGINGKVKKMGRRPKCRKGYILVGYYMLNCKN